VNQGTARVVIIVAMVVVGAAVLVNGFSSSGTPSATGPSVSSSAGPTGPTGSTSPTSQPTATQTPKPQKTGLTVLALNGTNVTGAASAAQDALLADGYTEVVPPADAPSKGVKKTTVYYREGKDPAQSLSDATYLADTYFPGAKVAKYDTTYDDIVPPTVQIVVVVGEDYASQLVGG
jgi:hypothetical protein